METLEAYETFYTDLYFGTDSVLADLSDGWVNQVNIGSQLVNADRAVLNNPYPRIINERVAYRASCQQVLVGEETDKLVQNASGGIVVVRFTDSQDVVWYKCAIASVPENAAAQGEVIGQITFQPLGSVYAAENWVVLTSAGVAAPAGAGRVAVFTGSGSYTTGGSTTNLSAGVHVIPAGSVTVAGRGFVAGGREVSA